MANQQASRKRPRVSSVTVPDRCVSIEQTTPAFLHWAKSLLEDEDYESNDEEEDDDDDDEDYLSDEDSCYLTEEERAKETRAVQALVKAAFDRTITEPYLTRLVGPQPKPTNKRIRLEKDRREPVEVEPDTFVKNVKPHDFLRAMLVSEGEIFKTFPALSLQRFFGEITPEFVEEYDMEVMKAVREEDIESLRRRMEIGRTLHCGNRFGESIIHAACRRGSVRVLKFLLKEAKVSCRVCCDSGRTPLHDACWTPEPNFEVVQLLLDACPDLLYISDKRGCTPLSYTRDLQSPDWCDFLSRQGVQRLAPRFLV